MDSAALVKDVEFGSPVKNLKLTEASVLNFYSIPNH
jgi:hypothetical protein